MDSRKMIITAIAQREAARETYTSAALSDEKYVTLPRAGYYQMGGAIMRRYGRKRVRMYKRDGDKVYSGIVWVKREKEQEK